MNQEQNQLMDLYKETKLKVDQYEREAHSTVVLLTDYQEGIKNGAYIQIPPNSDGACIFEGMKQKEVKLNQDIFEITDELRALEEKIGHSQELLEANVQEYLTYFSQLLEKRKESNLPDILTWLAKQGIVKFTH